MGYSVKLREWFSFGHATIAAFPMSCCPGMFDFMSPRFVVDAVAQARLSQMPIQPLNILELFGFPKLTLVKLVGRTPVFGLHDIEIIEVDCVMSESTSS